MKVTKITAIWCSSCLVMNKIWSKVSEKYNIETKELDIDNDSDEVDELHIGEVLPVFIFYKDGVEVKRLFGEFSENDLSRIIEKIGV